MGRSGFPTKLFILAGVVGVGGGALALVSRFRINAELNDVFKQLGLGQQSLVEHWLSAMSAVALFVFFVAFVSKLSKKMPFKKTWLRRYWFIKLRKRTLNVFRSVYIAHWTISVAMIYIGGSLSWELQQMEQRGGFQADQFSMDVIGSLSFCFLLWLLINSEYRQARLKRRSYLS
ncbi:hypothetical protein [Pseudomonas yamanorum]|uniref:hypothetical protein n=1 Tax=Pseudomonas yamanorum TaxID=515393 RepID=UPI002ED398E0|nr:hypothetical protein VYI69_27180 [Pseudomonas yamanorum]